jgi:hypothetical protein
MTRRDPLWQQALAYPASEDRNLMRALWPSGRVAGGVCTAVAGTMNVSIARGQAAVPLSGDFGTALCTWDAPETVALAPAPATGQDRYDLICALVRDPEVDGGANGDFVFVVIEGAPGAPPTEPAVPPNHLPLAQVTVVGGSANLDTATITDSRGQPLAVPNAGPWFNYAPRLVTATEVFLGTAGGWSAGRWKWIGPGLAFIDIHIGCGTGATAQDGAMWVHMPPGYVADSPPGSFDHPRMPFTGMLQVYNALGVRTNPSFFVLYGINPAGNDAWGERIALSVAVQGTTQDINIDTYPVTEALGPVAVPRMAAGQRLIKQGTLIHLQGTTTLVEAGGALSYPDVSLPTPPTPPSAKETP